MKVSVNGEPRELVPGTTVGELVSALPDVPDGRGLAVAVDGEVVPRGSWGASELRDGVSIEVVVAVQGG